MNPKGLKILTGVLAAAAVISGAVFLFSRGSNEAQLTPKEPLPMAYSYENSEYTKAVSVMGANGEIFLPAGVDNVYYTASLSGEINFYEYSGGSMVPSSAEKKQIKTSLKATYETIPVTVHYIEKGGKICGFGVFTSDMSADVDVYAYAFVKLTEKPSGYGDGYLLLADFDKDNFYKADKIYSEIYNFNLSNGSASTYVSNNTRLIDKNGSFRQDWTMLTDDFIANLGGNKYFLSSRYYNESEKGKRADIMVLSNAYRPEIVVEDMLGLWFVSDSNGMHYLRKTDNGFANILRNGSDEKILSEFEGDLFTDYLQCGKYIINKKSLLMTDLMTGAAQTLKDIDITSADVFSVSPDGAKAVFASFGEPNSFGTPVQKIIYCTADGSDDPAAFSEPMLFCESSGFVWLDNSTVMSVRPLSGDGSSAGSVAFTFTTNAQ